MSTKIVARKYVPFNSLSGNWFSTTSYSILGKSLNPKWYFVTALAIVIINTAFHKIFFQYLPIASLLLTNLNSIQLVSDLSHKIIRYFNIKPIKDI